MQNTNAKRHAESSKRYRLKNREIRSDNIAKAIIAAAEVQPKATIVQDDTEYTARIMYCPSCNGRLVRKNLNRVTAVKGCFVCKRKFTFTRVDTPEGRAQRAREWRRKQDQPHVDEAPGVVI